MNDKTFNIEKEFVTYPLALRLKAIGFDKPCVKYVYLGDTGTNCNVDGEVLPSKAQNFNADSLSISRPTYSQAFRWFRDNYDLWNCIQKYASSDSPTRCYYELKGDNINTDKDESPNSYMSGWFNSYEEAELECLNKLITIIEQQ